MKRLFYLAAVGMLSACGGNPTRTAIAEEVAPDCVQVLYFHGKQRCVTCNSIEQLTKEVVDSIGSNKVAMRVIDLTANKALADRYEVAWSSLILDRNGKIENLTKMSFSYAKNQPSVFKTKLTEAIARLSE